MSLQCRPNLKSQNALDFNFFLENDILKIKQMNCQKKKRVSLQVCLFVTLINVKISEPIGLKFFVATHKVPEKVYGCKKMLTFLIFENALI